MKLFIIVLMAVVGIFLISFFVLGIYALARVKRRENIKVDKCLISSLDSFEKASFVYKILADYWDKDESQRGRRLALKVMLENAHSPKEGKEIYELTPVWDQEEHEKVEKELQKLGVFLDG